MKYLIAAFLFLVAAIIAFNPVAMGFSLSLCGSIVIFGCIFLGIALVCF